MASQSNSMLLRLLWGIWVTGVIVASLMPFGLKRLTRTTALLPYGPETRTLALRSVLA